MSEGIILSILDTDLYKFTTGYAYAKLFPRARGRFSFFDRSETIYPQGFDKLVREELEKMSQLKLTDEEADFLRRECPYLPPFYIDYIKGYQYDPREVDVKLDEEGHLSISAEGLLYRITMWETPILAIVSELFYRVAGDKPDLEHVRTQAIEKAKMMKENGLQVSIFGMRRRFSSSVEDEITGLLKKYAGESLFGTSNVYFAMKHNIRVTGTHPHEWVQFHAALYGYKMANYMSMEHWINVYDGDLGTVLTDTYTTDVFMRNFSKKHAMLFTSLRHDSGDPYLFVDKAVKRYKELKIDPMLKYLVFSDSLNIPKAVDIKEYCKGKITATFGIGTNLTNDVGHDVVPMNIVMKLVACQVSPTQPWHHCVKLSDVEGKHTGDLGEIKLAQMTLGISTK
ncbi:nicotinate phosphoribosyltransferase [Porphyromonadaceae bacterium W3.11]|nr:nicotinate phosphoribosyltransferase [Porphyromonadaceae bacterium W3.11]